MVFCDLERLIGDKIMLGKINKKIIIEVLVKVLYLVYRTGFSVIRIYICEDG